VKVVFDTNIVASATFWRGKPFDSLSAWARGQCEAIVSPQVLSEYFDTTEELTARYPNRAKVAWAESLTQAATLVFPVDRARGQTADPDDEMFLECALAGAADLIVSGDKRHLLALREWRGIKLVSADAFLIRLRG
jgi:putative PIN family toxin of toxin-antitoxin system